MKGKRVATYFPNTRPKDHSAADAEKQRPRSQPSHTSCGTHWYRMLWELKVASKRIWANSGGTGLLKLPEEDSKEKKILLSLCSPLKHLD